MFVNSVASLALVLSLSAAPVHGADLQPPQPERVESAPVPERAMTELEPAGVASGTTVRQARIAQNWLLLTLGTAALAGIIFGLSSSGDSTTGTN